MRRKELGHLVLIGGLSLAVGSATHAGAQGTVTPVSAETAAPDGTTALHLAVRQNDLGAVDALITRGADVKATTRYGVTPMSLAAINGNAAILRMLLDAGADPNTATPGGETALMTAARTGSIEAVTLLLDRGANVNAKDTVRAQTALMWAVIENHPDIVKLLVATRRGRQRADTRHDAQGRVCAGACRRRIGSRDHPSARAAEGGRRNDAAPLRRSRRQSST